MTSLKGKTKVFLDLKRCREPLSKQVYGFWLQYGVRCYTVFCALREKPLYIFTAATGYEGEETEVDYCSMDLLWRPVGRMVRFVPVAIPVMEKSFS